MTGGRSAPSPTGANTKTARTRTKSPIVSERTRHGMAAFRFNSVETSKRISLRPDVFPACVERPSRAACAYEFSTPRRATGRTLLASRVYGPDRRPAPHGQSRGWRRVSDGGTAHRHPPPPHLHRTHGRTAHCTPKSDWRPPDHSPAGRPLLRIGRAVWRE